MGTDWRRSGRVAGLKARVSMPLKRQVDVSAIPTLHAA